MNVPVSASTGTSQTFTLWEGFLLFVLLSLVNYQNMLRRTHVLCTHTAPQTTTNDGLYRLSPLSRYGTV